MDQPTAAESAGTPATDEGEPAAIDFVRFCYRRRRVGWPELYDEMCAVAGRGLYHGYSADDLGGIGVGLTLFEMPAMAAIVASGRRRGPGAPTTERARDPGRSRRAGRGG